MPSLNILLLAFGGVVGASRRPQSSAMCPALCAGIRPVHHAVVGVRMLVTNEQTGKRAVSPPRPLRQRQDQ